MNIHAAKTVYLVGIKGVGMTALAVILQKMGKTVWGADVPEEFPTDKILRNNAIRVLSDFQKSHITSDIDLVVTTGAHGGLQNREVLQAREKNIEILTHAQALGQLMAEFRTKIAICGSHGKTTTAAITAYVMNELQLSFAHHVGTPYFSGLEGGNYTGHDYFVTEADEYVSSVGLDNTPRFLYLDPDFVICTNIDFDHPDVYKNLGTVKYTFLRFFKKLEKNNRTLIYCYDDENIKLVLHKVPRLKTISYGFSKKADWVIQTHIDNLNNDTVISISLSNERKQIPSFTLSPLLPGKHNVLNTVAVLILFSLLGQDMKKIAGKLEEFMGSARRFEKIFETNNIVLYDDYAHHPTEIKATVEAARQAYPKRRIVILFQPHMQSRAQTFAREFIGALSKADKAYLLDIFTSAREEKGIITSEKLAKGTKVSYLPENKIKDILSKEIKGGDIVIGAGAGDIYKYYYDIISIIKHVT